MTAVLPFRAVRYQAQRTSGMEHVVTPPYDVIDPDQQDLFYRADPHNVIRLELGKPLGEKPNGLDRYGRAAALYHQWLEQGILARDDQPAFYVLHSEYTDQEGRVRVRHGFFGLLRVAPYAEGPVRPHERTFGAHKADRLKLLQAVGVNTSPIFAIYPDRAGLAQNILESGRSRQPLCDFTDFAGQGQRLYQVTSPACLAQVRQILAHQTFYIADGHHRYETSQEHRRQMLEREPKAGPNTSFHYILAYMCAMEEPGLSVFATHRLVAGMRGLKMENFLGRASRWFEVERRYLPEDPTDATRAITQALAQANRDGVVSLALGAPGGRWWALLRMKPGAMTGQTGPEVEGPLRNLDVPVLSRLVLQELLGLDEEQRTKLVSYSPNARDVLAALRQGQADLAFFMNPTKLEQVRAVSDAGLVMPKKSTYFFPKVLTGLVMNQVEPVEELA